MFLLIVLLFQCVHGHPWFVLDRTSIGCTQFDGGSNYMTQPVEVGGRDGNVSPWMGASQITNVTEDCSIDAMKNTLTIKKSLEFLVRVVPLKDGKYDWRSAVCVATQQFLVIPNDNPDVNEISILALSLAQSNAPSQMKSNGTVQNFIQSQKDPVLIEILCGDLSSMHLASMKLSPTDAAEAKDLNGTVVSVSTYKGWKKGVPVHAFFMLAAFALCFPFGVVVARLKHMWGDGKWFHLHMIVQLAGTVLFVVGFIAAFYATSLGPVWIYGKVGSQIIDAHVVIGAILVALVGVQVIGGVLRPPHDPPPNVSEGDHKSTRITLRTVFEVAHRTTGYSIVLLGMANLAIGIYIYKDRFHAALGNEYYVAFIVVYVLFLIIPTLLYFAFLYFVVKEDEQEVGRGNAITIEAPPKEEVQ